MSDKEEAQALDFVTMFRTARDWVEPLLGAAQDADLDAESINEGWTLRMLLAHMIHTVDMFARGLRGADVTNDAEGNLAKPFDEDAILDAFRSAAEDLWAAQHEPGNADRDVLLPIGPTPGAIMLGMAASEFALHGWDLGRSIGQDPVIPEELAEPLEAFNRPAIPMMVEIGMYAPSPDVPDGASWHTRLLAVAGRRA